MKHRRAPLLAAFVLAAVCASCAHQNPHYDPAKPHHTPAGFRNNYVSDFFTGSFWKWQWQRWREGLPMPPADGYASFPVQRPDLDWLRQNRSEASATWIGHATVLLQVGGLNILTDPVFSERVSPVSWAGPKRKVPLPAQLHELPRIDVVIVSHNHYDHLDLPTLKALAAQEGGPPMFMMPLGVGDWLKEQGVPNVAQLDWWQAQDVSQTRIHFVPVQHWSARGPFDRFDTLWGGWVIESRASGKPFLAFFTGDTGYSKDFVDIHRRYGDFDLALIPVGAYEPRWFMRNQHVDPTDAVRIHRDLRARQSLAIHWGTFELTDESLDEPPRALKRALHEQHVNENSFVVLPHGGMLKFTESNP